MKHSLKIILLLLAMFFFSQLVGIFVIHQYAPTTDEEGNLTYNLPFGLEPPQEVKPRDTVISIVIAIALAVFIMFILMKYKFEVLLRIWFFVVVSLALGITLNSFILKIPYSSIIAIAVAVPLAYFKIFKRGILIHNLTELAVYPGIAAIFVPLLSIWSIVILLILISFYDMYAVWHSGFMQKMAKYQIEKIKVFSGFFVPYVGKKQKEIIAKISKSKSKNLKERKIKVNVAILGGGDVVFPIILAGVVLNTWGLVPALLISLGATMALAGLFYISKKGKFYPAMPFITAGCFIGLGLASLI